VSQQHLEERVAVVEREQARQGVKIDCLAQDMTKVSAGVEKLLEREGQRGEPVGFRAVAAVCGGLVAIAIVGSWLIEHSPSVDAIKDRLNQLDNEKTGRVTRLEKDAGWAAKVYVEK
jgi:hypothetical protein